MNTVQFRVLDDDAGKDLNDPILVEGLPGVGNVGKLAADHLADALDAVPWCEVHSRDFPPQVSIEDGAIIKLVNATLAVARGAAAGRDVVLLRGDYQPLTAVGQHDLVDGVLDLVADAGCREIFTLGGYGLGSSVEDPGVLGAGTDADTVARIEAAGVRADQDDLPASIIGVSGLLLGLGAQRGAAGACLMGETSGFIADAKAAGAVIEALRQIIDLPDIDLEALQQRADEFDRIAEQMRQAQSAPQPDPADLRYIG